MDQRYQLDGGKNPTVALRKSAIYLCELVHKVLDPLARDARGRAQPYSSTLGRQGGNE